MGTWVWDYETQREVWRDDVLADGESLRVPLMLCESAQKDVRDHYVRDQFVRDQLATHNACAGHRPGRGLDALIHAAQPTVTVDAVSDDLVARRGTALADAMLERQRALDETERRQQWRTVLDARVKVEPPDGDDEDDGDESDGRELAGSAEYPGGDYAGNDDDDANDEQHGSEEYPHNGGRYPDGSVLTEAERAYQERTQRGDQLWRTGSAVSRADANQRQLERWRGK